MGLVNQMARFEKLNHPLSNFKGWFYFIVSVHRINTPEYRFDPLGKMQMHNFI